MTGGLRPVVSGRGARDRAAQAGYRPGVASVRLVGPPDTIDAALKLLADMMGEKGDAWQPSTRKPGRHSGGDELQHGTLIVPVPREMVLDMDCRGGNHAGCVGPPGTRCECRCHGERGTKPGHRDHDPATCRNGDHYGQCPGVTR